MPGTHRILIADCQYFGGPDFFSYEQTHFGRHGCEVHFANCTTEADIIEQGTGMHAILCCGNPPIGKQAFESLPELKAVLRYGVGYNSIDTQEAAAHGVMVLYMPGFCAEELATHSLGMTISLLKSLSLHDRNMRKGVWEPRTGNTPKRISGMTIGLYGFGKSARILAQIYSQGFGAEVIAYDPYTETTRIDEVRIVELNELLERSDVISIHSPQTAETFHAFDQQAFEKMKDDALLINVSRGAIVHEDSLIDALKTGKIAGAGLDVFETEPLSPDSPLLKMDQVILSPHSSYYSADSVQIQHETAVSSVLEALKGNCPPNTANKDLLKTNT